MLTGGPKSEGQTSEEYESQEARLKEWFQAGVTAARVGRLQQARSHLRRVIAHDPHNEEAWLWLAGVADDPQESLACLAQVLTINPRNKHAKAGIRWARAKLVEERRASTSYPTDGVAFPTVATAPSPLVPREAASISEKVSFRRAMSLAVVASAIFGAAAGWAVWEPTISTYPVWLMLAAPLVGLIVVLIGLLNYDLLVLTTFCLIGFVRVEPAPFDLLVVVLLGVGLLTGRLRWPSSKQGTVVQIGLWGLTVTNMLSTVGVIPIYDSLRFLSITLYLLALFCFVRMYATEPHAVRIVLVGYLMSAVINVLAVVLGFLGVSLPVPVVVFSIRGIGFFKDPNVYAPFVIVAALWIGDQAVQRSSSFTRTGPLLLLVGLLGAGATLSLSRAAWINLALGGFLYFVLLLRGGPRTHIARAFVLAMAVVLAAIFAVQFLGLGDVIARRARFQIYDTMRFRIQRGGLLAALSHPLGVGPGGWRNAHSLYVRTLAEHGVLGLTALGVLIGGLVVPLARRALQEPARNQVLPDRVLLACIGGQLVNSLVIDSIHWRHLWVILGLAWASLEMQRGEKQ